MSPVVSIPDQYNGRVRVSPIRLRVKELRTVRGWSQEELSRRAEVRQATISDLENGKAKSIDLALLERLARAFEVDAGYLFVTTAGLTSRKRPT